MSRTAIWIIVAAVALIVIIYVIRQSQQTRAIQYQIGQDKAAAGLAPGATAEDWRQAGQAFGDFLSSLFGTISQKKKEKQRAEMIARFRQECADLHPFDLFEQEACFTKKMAAAE